MFVLAPEFLYPEDFLERHHKDEDNSNNNSENCEILYPLVHTHITRKTDMAGLINDNPRRFIYYYIDEFNKSNEEGIL